MPIKEAHEGKATILQLSGRLDSETSPATDDKLSSAVAASEAIVLDLSELEYISSAGLRVLLRAAKQAQAAKHRFAVAAARPAVMDVFNVGGFSAIFPIHATLAEALAKMR